MLTSAAIVAFVPVRDIEVARQFYITTLGLTLRDESPFALVVTAGATTLRITPIPDFRPQPFTIVGWDVADIQAEVEGLAQRGVTFNRYEGIDQDDRGIWTAPGGALVAWFADPDGNTLSLTTSTPEGV